MPKTIIVIENNRITITTDTDSEPNEITTEPEKPYHIDFDDEIPGRPHIVTESGADIMLEQANRFADQMADKMVKDPIVGSAVRESLDTPETMEAIDAES